VVRLQAPFRNLPVTRNRVIVGVLGLAALLLLALIVYTLFFQNVATTSNVRTATVRAGTVRTAVTGTGTLQPSNQQNVAFREGGQLSEVDVKVGDPVTAGQVVAKLDPAAFQSALQQAQGSLASAQANLNNTVSGNAVATAQHNLATAQTALAQAQTSASTTAAADDAAVSAAQRTASATLAADDAAVSAAQKTLSFDQSQLASAEAALATCLAPHPPPGTCTPQQTAVDTARGKVLMDQNALTAAERKRNLDSASQEALVTQAEQRRNTDAAAAQTAINQAQGQVSTAQDALDNATISRPNTIAQLQGTVTSSAAMVQVAQQNLDNATLKAPVDGTVATINGAVGEQVQAGGGTTTLAPGTFAPQPTATGATSTAAGSAVGAGLSTTPLLVLSNVSAFQVVAPLAEGDAARVQPNQSADVTFDAVPSLDVTGRVLSVAPGATVISNVTNYYVTITLDQLDNRLRAGMTANASIVVSQVENVLTVPNAAIQRSGGQTFVTVLLQDGKTQNRVAVQTGVQGDTMTEVTTGLNEGDRVVLPTVRAPTATGGPGGGGGGGRGSGG
jgi:HlyD family secretion protein